MIYDAFITKVHSLMGVILRQNYFKFKRHPINKPTVWPRAPPPQSSSQKYIYSALNIIKCVIFTRKIIKGVLQKFR
jgi:hypothetical protein